MFRFRDQNYFAPTELGIILYLASINITSLTGL